eukprot:407301-Rhodomonas_salina.1
MTLFSRFTLTNLETPRPGIDKLAASRSGYGALEENNNNNMTKKMDRKGGIVGPGTEGVRNSAGLTFVNKDHV